MGKYMRKGKSVDKMPVLEGALGVRTRARALALQRHASSPDPAESKQQAPTDSLKKLSASGMSTDCLTKTAVPAAELPSEEHYMELRSRRLGRVSSKGSIARPRKEVTPSLLKNSISRRSISDEEASRIRISSNACAQISRCQHLPLPARSSDASEMQSSAIDAGSAHLRRLTPSASTSNSVCMPERPPLRILTRHQRQTLGSLDRGDMDVDEEEVAHTRRAERSPAVHADTKTYSTEVEQFCGESAAIMGPSNAERHRRGTRESTPDSYFRCMEAPGSTTRSRHAHRGQSRSLSAPPFNRANEAPSSSEIEAFFQGVEQQERRKFIERYNFDPANERPLRGRYEWMSL